MKTFIALIVVVIVIAGGYFLFTHKAAAPTAEAPVVQEATTAPNSMPAPTTPPPATAKTVSISFTSTGFSPKSVTVTAGTKVTWVNNSSEQMWVASNPHPIHNGYDGTTVSQHCTAGAPTSDTVLDECATVPAGGTFTFTANKVGTWGYHNHADHAMTGTLVVTQ